jgi:hypothetical protein
MGMMTLRMIVLIMVTVCAVDVARAYRVTEYTLDAKVAKADLVVLVRALATNRTKTDRIFGTTTLVVEQTLKGRSEAIISFTRSGFVELNPDCCVEGARYLMFLEKIPNGAYMAVNGRHGVYRVDATKRDSAPR